MKRIYRSVRDKKIFGVCGGLAEATGIDATIIRIVLVITTVFSGFAPVPIYLIAAMVMPKDPTFSPYGGGGNYDGGTHYGRGTSYGSGGSAHWNPHRTSWETPPQQPPFTQPPQQPPFGQPAQGYYPPNESAKRPSIDDLMEDIEKKAMSKEIEELKAKLAKYEKE